MSEHLTDLTVASAHVSNVVKIYEQRFMSPIKVFKPCTESSAQVEANARWVFRGQANIDWDLKPSISRADATLKSEIEIFKSWKESIALNPSFRDFYSTLSDLDILMFAQHYGVPTRLMDWTSDILTATYFAVRSHWECDGVVRAVFPIKQIVRDLESGTTANERYSTFNSIYLEECAFPIFIEPRIKVPRVQAQAGLFSLHQPPTLSYSDWDMWMDELSPETELWAKEIKPMNSLSYRVIIPAKYKKAIKAQLIRLGKSGINFFPDLEGLGMHLREDFPFLEEGDESFTQSGGMEHQLDPAEIQTYPK